MITNLKFKLLALRVQTFVLFLSVELLKFDKILKAYVLLWYVVLILWQIIVSFLYTINVSNV